MVNEVHQRDALLLQAEVARLREELAIYRALHADVTEVRSVLCRAAPPASTQGWRTASSPAAMR